MDGTPPDQRAHRCQICGTPTDGDSFCNRHVDSEADHKAADDEHKAETSLGNPDDTAAPDQPEHSEPSAEFAALVTESNRRAVVIARAIRLADAQAAPNWHERLIRLRAVHPNQFAQLAPANYGIANFRRSHMNQTVWNGPRAFLDKAFASLSPVGVKRDGVMTTEYRFSMRTDKAKDFTGAGLTPRAAYLDALRKQRLAAHDVAELVRQVGRLKRANNDMTASYTSVVRQNTDQVDLIMKLGARCSKLENRRDSWRHKYEDIQSAFNLEVALRQKFEAQVATLQSEVNQLKAAATDIEVEMLPSSPTNDITQITTASS
jgi:hypothetical protein